MSVPNITTQLMVPNAFLAQHQQLTASIASNQMDSTSTVPHASPDSIQILQLHVRHASPSQTTAKLVLESSLIQQLPVWAAKWNSILQQTAKAVLPARSTMLIVIPACKMVHAVNAISAFT